MQYRSSRMTIAIRGVVAAGARAQTPAGEARVARLTGRVADAVGSSIPKAEILVTNTSLHAETGSDGRFEMTNLPAGPIEVVVRRLGYSPAKIALELMSGEVREIGRASCRGRGEV